MQLVFSPDGKTLASSAADAQVRLWDVATAREKNKLARVYVTTFPIAFTPDGDSVVVSGATGSPGPGTSRPEASATCSRSTGSARWPIRRTDGCWPPRLTERTTARSAFSARRPRSAVRRRSYRDLGQSHATTGSFAPSPPVPVGGLEPAAGSSVPSVPPPLVVDVDSDRPDIVVGTTSSGSPGPPPTLVVTGSLPIDSAMLQSLGNATIVKGASPAREITCLAFAPDGQTLVAGEWHHGNATHDLVIWNFSNGVVKARLTGQTSAIRGVAYSPDGRWLAAVSGDGTGPEHDGEARIWDARTNKERARLVGHRGPIWALAFTHDGRALITGGAGRDRSVLGYAGQVRENDRFQIPDRVIPTSAIRNSAIRNPTLIAAKGRC